MSNVFRESAFFTLLIYSELWTATIGKFSLPLVSFCQYAFLFFGRSLQRSGKVVISVTQFNQSIQSIDSTIFYGSCFCCFCCCFCCCCCCLLLFLLLLFLLLLLLVVVVSIVVIGCCLYCCCFCCCCCWRIMTKDAKTKSRH